MGQITPWADLPQELLSAIATFLSSNPVYIFCFRAVCKSWRSSVYPPSSLLSPPLPRILHCPPVSFSHFYSSGGAFPPVLSATAVYAVRSVEVSLLTPKTWLLFVDQLNPGKASVRLPLARGSFAMPLDFPRELNLLDFRLSEIGRYYNLSHGYHDRFGQIVKPSTWNQGLLKVVFLSNGLAVVALSEDSKVGLLRLGVEGNVMGDGWEIIHNGRGFRFDDIVEYKDRVLGIDRRGRVYDMGHHFTEMKWIVPPIAGGGGRRKRLIESYGTLYLVVRCGYLEKEEKMGFKVYKLNETFRKWIEVPSIGDQILFFGISCSFSASAQELEGFCGKNCIMYEEHSFREYDRGYGDSWLFHESGHSSLRVGVYHFEVGGCLRAVESYPCYSNILWPPPAWIWLNSKSKLLGTLEAAIGRVLLGSCDENLKARYGELSSVVGLLVSGDGISQQEVPNILKEVDILKKFIIGIDLEIQEELKNIMKNITEDAVARYKQKDSSHSTERSYQTTHGCVHCLQKATQDSSNDYEWVRREMERRLHTHFELSEILRGVLNMLEEQRNLKKILKPGQQASM